MDFGAVSVSELNAYLKTKFMVDDILNGLYVRGEISNLTRHGSGHVYFTLKDQDSRIKAVMFRPQALRLKFIPENGMRVLVHCDVRVFERDGVYQLYAHEILPDGVGALALRFEQLKRKLEAAGIFDEERKKPVPGFPSRIGVITSRTGAVFHDIVNVLERRYPLVTLTLIPAAVQGERASASIAGALKFADTQGFDTLILARGGGSIEELQGFNTEETARAVYNCGTPVISAVGHETDFTLADFAADLRAPTPSAAAELAARDMGAIKLTLDKTRRMMYNYTVEALRGREQALSALTRRLRVQRPAYALETASRRLDSLRNRLQRASERDWQNRARRYSALIGRLNALSPLAVLARGYSITYKDGGVLRTGADAAMGDELKIRLRDAVITGTVTKIER